VMRLVVVVVVHARRGLAGQQSHSGLLNSRSSSAAVYRPTIKDLDHLNQVLDNFLDIINQELICSAGHLKLNDCYWSFVLRVERVFLC